MTGEPYQLKPGDWIGTIGRGGLLEPVYAGIREYARRKYPVRPWNPDPVWGITHVRVVISFQQVFEMTTPVGRVMSFRRAKLAEKFEAGLVRVVTWPNATSLDVPALEKRARELEGQVYDVLDLADFGLSGLLGIYNHVISLFGHDRARRFKVCSTAAADIMRAGGLQFPVDPDSVDPNAPFNKFGLPPDAWLGATWNPIPITHLLTKESFA